MKLHFEYVLVLRTLAKKNLGKNELIQKLQKNCFLLESQWVRTRREENIRSFFSILEQGLK